MNQFYSKKGARETFVSLVFNPKCYNSTNNTFQASIMYIEQTLVAETPGKFVFMRPEKEGVTPFEVQTDFTNEQLAGIFNLTSPEGYWTRFEGILETVSSLGSGVARDILNDNFAFVPIAFGLKEKNSAILKMNVVFVLTDLMPVAFDDFPRDLEFMTNTFIGQDPFLVAEIITGLKTELGALLTANDWLLDIEATDKQAIEIISRVEHLRVRFKVN